MLVDPVKHYFYIWLICLRLSHACGWHSLAILKSLRSVWENLSRPLDVRVSCPPFAGWGPCGRPPWQGNQNNMDTHPILTRKSRLILLIPNNLRKFAAESRISYYGADDEKISGRHSDFFWNHTRGLSVCRQDWSCVATSTLCQVYFHEPPPTLR